MPASAAAWACSSYSERTSPVLAMKSAPASIACWKAGPGLALSELIRISSQPSASVAASTPTVM